MNYLKHTWLFAFFLIVSTSFAQNFNMYYPDNNTLAGYDNAVYDGKSGTYFLVEYDHDISVDYNAAFHVKQIDGSGNLINHNYFPSDFAPWSGHYISTIEVQGKELVIFLNRIIESPFRQEVMVIRIPKSLTGTATSERIYLNTGDNPGYSHIKVNECVRYGGKIIFTGSVYAQSALNLPATKGKLLMGIIDIDGSIYYDVFENKDNVIEGLSLLPNPKSGAVFVSCRFAGDETKDVEIPLILRFRVNDLYNYFDYVWGRTYPSLRIDISSDYSSYNEGIEVPLIESFTKYNAPAFIARDKDRENLVFVPFNRITGDQYGTYVRRIIVPKNKELIDAVKLPDTKNGIAVLFTRKEMYTIVNTESYLVSCKNLYGFFSSARIHFLNSPTYTNALQARRILLPGKDKMAIAGLANRVELPLSGLYRASLMQSNDLSFGCVDSKGLKKPIWLDLKAAKTPVYKVPFDVSFEDREMGRYQKIVVTEYDLCLGGKGMIQENTSEEINSNMDIIQLTVYPNPATDQINVLIPETNNGLRTIIIRNIAGEIVFEQEISNYEVNVNVNTSALTKGVYILSVYQNEQILDAKRIIITR